MTPRQTLPLLFAAVAVGPAAADAAGPAFARDALGFVGKHCLACHNDARHKADLSLERDRDPAAVARRRKQWEGAVRAVRDGDMPPDGKPRPTVEEREAFARGVRGVLDAADRAAGPDPGRVTARRLNRFEYKNTVRDLCGVAFDPTDDFPSDDVGHGFDNIGDVLSVSPVLLERYLAAADAVVARAIVSDPPTPVHLHIPAGELSPELPDGSPTVRYRPLVKKSRPLTVARPLAAGVYRITTRVYVDPPRPKPVSVAVTVDGQRLQLRTFDVSAGEKEPQLIEITAPLPAGEPQIGVALRADLDGGAVYVEHIALDGPLAPRPPSHDRLLACDPAKPEAERTREVLARFASRAYRRPATPAEVERLARIAAATTAAGGKWEAGVQDAMRAALVSPKFLFRLEPPAGPPADAPKPLDEYQLAARLSYFLWASMPDDELTALAAAGRLSANVEAQVRRMLADPKSRALTDGFAVQWLQLRRLAAFHPDRDQFPGFDEPLRAAMLEETARFFDGVVREDRSVLDLIDADYTFLNVRLAEFYGVPFPGSRDRYGRDLEFRKVRLPDNTRGGVLTQASVLAVTSNPTRTSPVKRGKWVLEQILGTPPPPPPPNVPELDADAEQPTGTLRQRLEQHRADAGCANCHARMDPIGFAFEHFDAIGAYRETDGGAAIDDAATLPDGQTVRGAAGLKAVLLGKKDSFARCLGEKLLTYALGRGLEAYDRPAADRIAGELVRGDYKFSALAVAVATSDPFRLRRGREKTDE